MGDCVRAEEAVAATRALQAADMTVLRAEKDLAKLGDKHRRDGSASATTAAEASSFSGVLAAVTAGTPCTPAGPYPVAGAVVPLRRSWDPPIFRALLPLWEPLLQGLGPTPP